MNDNVLVTLELVKKYIALTETAREKATPAKLTEENSKKLTTMIRTVSYTHLRAHETR